MPAAWPPVCTRSATRPAGSFMPEPVFANIGKLLLATQIYDMHRLAHEVSAA
jgi:4-hydroxybutyryl-CoA dehydratase / vinylacetyl-CoA-Delta-isomerase